MKPQMAGPLAVGGLMAWIGAGLGHGGPYSFALWPTSLVLMVLAMLAARRRVVQRDERSASTSIAAHPAVMAAALAVGALLGVATARREVAWVCVAAAAAGAMALGVHLVRRRRQAHDGGASR